jgi:chemotaxis protein CheC
LKGTFSGNALLTFPEEKYLALLTMLARASKPGDVPCDALREAGTTLLAAFISSLASALDTTFEMGLPAKDRGDIRTILGTRVQNHVVLQVQIHATIEQQPIEGFAAFVINTTSFDEPMRGVYRFMTRNGRTPADARRAR